MTARVDTYIRLLAARNARGLPETSRPLKQRAQGRPGARCTRGLVCNVHKKCAHEHTGPAESIRPSLRNGFTAYFVISPERPALLPPSLREIIPQSLAPASGRQDHTFLPYASSHARQSQLSRPPHLTARS